MNVIANPTIKIEPSEIWSSKNPQRGDHIRVCRMNGIYFHHGIFVAADEVIHFTGDDDDSVLDWSKAHVIKTDLKNFLRGGTVEVKEYTDAELADLYPVEGIVNYARACLGDGGYNLLFNNCEHFANACTLGKYRSRQVEKIFGGNHMGIFGKISEWIGGLFGGGSSSSSSNRSTTNYNHTYTYELDKVKIAEIERDKQAKLAKIEADKSLALADKEIARAKIEHAAQVEYLQVQTQARMAEAAQQAKFAEMEHEWQLKLADKENERIGLMRDAQLDIIKAQTMSQIMIEQARVEGQMKLAARLVALKEKLSELAGQQLLIIATGNMEVVRDIEKYYGELTKSIEARKHKYITEELPRLLTILRQYEKDSTEYEIFSAQINDDRAQQGKFIEQQMDAVLKRQQTVLEQAGMSEQKIIEQTGETIKLLAAGYMQSQVADALPSGTNSEFKQLPGVDDIKKLSGTTHETKMLPEPAAE